MADLYPLKFIPILKERVWGGKALANNYGKDDPGNRRIGESWEISGLQGDLSMVSNGFLAGNNIEEISEVYMGDLLGDVIYEKFGKEFPLLVKLIDARERLSLQVHPGNSIAAERHNAYGKTEMWYIFEAEKDSFIQAGFNRHTSKDEFLRAVENKTHHVLMNTINPDPGDIIYIPSGRVHALGDGVVLAEIQQTSDITYRIYDWDRPGLDGRPRELHTDLAGDVIDYSVSEDHHRKISPINNSAVELLSSPFFKTNIIQMSSSVERDYSGLDSFIILLGTEGSAVLEYNRGRTEIQKGETVLIPATIENLKINTRGSAMLEIYIDN